jgi:hypothetical protein
MREFGRVWGIQDRSAELSSQAFNSANEREFIHNKPREREFKRKTPKGRIYTETYIPCSRRRQHRRPESCWHARQRVVHPGSDHWLPSVCSSVHPAYYRLGTGRSSPLWRTRHTHDAGRRRRRSSCLAARAHSPAVPTLKSSCARCPEDTGRLVCTRMNRP